MLSQFGPVLKVGNQRGFYPCVLRVISVQAEPHLGHLRYCVTDMPPQPNSPPDLCLETRRSPGQGWIPAPRFIAKNGSGTAAPDGYGAALTGHAAPTPNGQGEPSRGSRGQTSASRSPIIR
jgi:hypothetical protein